MGSISLFGFTENEEIPIVLQQLYLGAQQDRNFFISFSVEAENRTHF
jgi:hypothetical protein